MNHDICILSDKVFLSVTLGLALPAGSDPIPKELDPSDLDEVEALLRKMLSDCLLTTEAVCTGPTTDANPWPISRFTAADRAVLHKIALAGFRVLDDRKEQGLR